MNQDYEQLKLELEELKKKFDILSKSSYYDFQKDIKILDGRKISGGTNKGNTFSGNISFTGTKIGFLGSAARVAYTPGGAATASGTYGNTEKNMLQSAYDTLRAFGLLA